MDKNVADKIVEKIVADLKDCRGLRQEWEGIPASTKREIKKRWKMLVEKELIKECDFIIKNTGGY